MTQPTHLSNHVVSDRLAPHKLSAVRSWAANRPGELQPATTPEGAYVGSPGPNQGFALTIARRLGHDAVLSTGEDLHDVEVGVAAIACRRAAMFGRAPSVYDVRHALGIFGYLDTASSELVEVRRARFSGVGHSYPLVRALADSVPVATLSLSPREALELDWREAIGA